MARVGDGAGAAPGGGGGGEVRSGVSPDPDRVAGREGRGSGGLLDPDWIERGESGATGGLGLAGVRG